MNFMHDNEFLLLMNFNAAMKGTIAPALSVDARSKLREAGIETAIEYPPWCIVEPSKGVYSSAIDNILDMNRKAGMKTIFSVCEADFPDWMPDEWFIKNRDGVCGRLALSPWNVEATEHQQECYHYLIESYTADDVMFVLAEHMNGEALLPCEPYFYDEFAISCYKEIYGTSAYPDISTKETKDWLKHTFTSHLFIMQEIFIKQHNEIWNMQQWLLNQWSEATVNFAQPAILDMYRFNFPKSNIVLLQYTYYDDAHPKENADYVDMLRTAYNCETIVEARFCKGLRDTAPKSIEKGFRGQIICPVHPIGGYTEFENWMVEDIRWAHDLWSEHASRI